MYNQDSGFRVGAECARYYDYYYLNYNIYESCLKNSQKYMHIIKEIQL